jgi:hypothetical protein
VSGPPTSVRGPFPQYRTKETGFPSAILSAMDRSINCGSAGCSRLNAQVLKERRTVSAVTWFFFFEWLCDPFLADRAGCR